MKKFNLPKVFSKSNKNKSNGKSSRFSKRQSQNQNQENQFNFNQPRMQSPSRNVFEQNINQNPGINGMGNVNQSNQFQGQNDVPIREYYEESNMTGETNIEGWGQIKQIGQYSPYVNEKDEIINNRRREVNPEKANRFGGKEKIENIKNNEYIGEISKYSKEGFGKAEKFLVGDLQGIKREKKKDTDIETDDYKISISRDDYDNSYNVLPEKQIEYKTKKTIFGKVKQVPIREKSDKKGGLLRNSKLRRNEKNKEKQKREEREQTVEKNYQYLRKEIDGYSPLYRLDFLDKIRVTKRFLDDKSGRTARRQAKKLQEEQRKKIEMQSTLKRKLSETLKPLLDKDIQLQRIEITLPKGQEDVCDYVLRQDYFSMFDIRKIKPNPNLKHYKVNIPILLEFKLAGRDVEIKN